MQYFCYFFLFLLVSAPAFAVSQEYYLKRPAITIAADDWCPVNCQPPESKSGVGIDLAKAIFESQGYRINYVVMPWSEALAKVRSGQVDAVVGAARSDDTTLVFPSQHLLQISDDFYVAKGMSWRFQGVHTLKNKKLGIIADYGYGAQVKDYIRANQSNLSLIQVSHGNDALKSNIKKLLNREIDVVVEAKPVMEYNISRMRLGGKVEWAGGVQQLPVYLAFSPALSKSRGLADLFDAGMRKLAAEGRLEGFYTPYGLSLGDR